MKGWWARGGHRRRRDPWRGAMARSRRCGPCGAGGCEQGHGGGEETDLVGQRPEVAVAAGDEDMSAVGEGRADDKLLEGGRDSAGERGGDIPRGCGSGRGPCR